MQGGGHRHPGPFPAQWLGWLSSPLHQRSSPNIWGEEQARLGRSHLGCLKASQRDGEALREARMAPCLPEPSCLHAKATGRRPQVHQVSSTPSRQDTKQTQQEWKWSPLLSSRGAVRRPGCGQRAQGSPDLTPLHIQSHTLTATIHRTALGSSKSQTTNQTQEAGFGERRVPFRQLD